MSGFEELAGLCTFRPLERPLECYYRTSPFSRNWLSTVRLLATELRMHGAQGAVMELDMREQDFRVSDGLPRGDRQTRTPGIVLAFKATAVVGSPELRYEVATYASWRDNVLAVAKGLESLRAVDRYGVTRRGEQYAGWKALPAGSVGSGGNITRGAELVDAAAGDIKVALHDAHPDHGGEADDFRDIIAWRESKKGKH